MNVNGLLNVLSNVLTIAILLAIGGAVTILTVLALLYFLDD
jgi:hypothetical protein